MKPLAVLLFAVIAPATFAKETLAPIPFKAQMEVIRGSLTFASGEIGMQQRDDGAWVQHAEVTAQGLAVIVKSGTLEEDSVFHWRDGNIVMDHYEMMHHDKKLTMRGRKEISEKVRGATFDWSAKQAELFKEGETATVDVPTGTVSAQLIATAVQQRLRLNGVPAEGDMLPINFADKLKVRRYEFFAKGKKTLETAFGSFDCVILERDSGRRITRLWAAPELDYFILRLDKEKKDDEPITTRMLALELNGKPVKK